MTRRALLALLAPAATAPGDLSLLLYEQPDGRLVVQRNWPRPTEPIPVGSLVKPFTALAWPGEPPSFRCRGFDDGCWSPAPHGRLNLPEALAVSCNAYFRQLSRGIRTEQAVYVARRLGLAGPPRTAPPEALVGLGAAWREAPTALLGAYSELARRRRDPGVAAVLAGLAAAARNGTAAALARLPRPAYGKTGTAPCTHGGGDGDGFALALYPAETPRYALLVRVHERTGRQAAEVARAALSQRLGGAFGAAGGV